VQMETEDDADPPALETSPVTSAESAPSGQDSSDAGESSPQTSMENGSGTPDWVISATSGQVISPSWPRTNSRAAPSWSRRRPSSA